MSISGTLSRYLAPSAAALAAMFLVGCDLSLPDATDGIMEEQSSDPCADVWSHTFDSCLEGCIGFACIENTCGSQANVQYAQCCQTMGGSASFDPGPGCSVSP